ncbi:hypothetical protein NQ318_018586 [Aromia moschata]|uniref:Uncharacterized protein n=1 Tax=Aromia moschata TaxID=1265417 RepID=A0AAV8ZFD2_9CUCU|nr:hypothetical protein NQ318_018586 [Aromia moschata]
MFVDDFDSPRSLNFPMNNRGMSVQDGFSLPVPFPFPHPAAAFLPPMAPNRRRPLRAVRTRRKAALPRNTPGPSKSNSNRCVRVAQARTGAVSPCACAGKVSPYAFNSSGPTKYKLYYSPGFMGHNFISAGITVHF